MKAHPHSAFDMGTCLTQTKPQVQIINIDTTYRQIGTHKVIDRIQVCCLEVDLQEEFVNQHSQDPFWSPTVFKGCMPNCQSLIGQSSCPLSFQSLFELRSSRCFLLLAARTKKKQNLEQHKYTRTSKPIAHDSILLISINM